MVNFAHGEFVMLGMFGSFWLYTLTGVDPLVSLPLVALMMFGLGLLLYRTIIRSVMRAPMLAQMFATFGLMLLLQNLAQFLWSPNFRLIQEPLTQGRIDLWGIYLGLPQMVAGLGALVAFTLLNWFINGTGTGRALRATAQDRDAALLMGINTERINLLGWGIAAASAGIAGVLLSNFFYVHPRVGLNFALIAFVVVALGGFGSIVGALIAAVIVGLTESLGSLLLPPSLKYAVLYAIYFLVVLLRPSGLLGKY